MYAVLTFFFFQKDFHFEFDVRNEFIELSVSWRLLVSISCEMSEWCESLNETVRGWQSECVSE